IMKVAREVAAKKPILAMKAGRTMQGAKAAASHTGGLAKEDLATDLIFKKAGVLTFMDEGELIQAAAAFASQPIPKGNRVGLITNTGGPAVIATDILVGAGAEIPPLSQKTEALLKDSLFPEASVNNPVDVLATGNAAHYRTCMDAMIADDSFDALYINFVTPFFVDTDSIAKEIAEVSQQGRKPMVCNLMTDKKQWAETTNILMQAKVPTYALPGEAARAMTALVRYQDIRARNIGKTTAFNDVDKDKVSRILSRSKETGLTFLTAADVYDILEAYGIPSAKWSMVGTAEQGVAAAEDLGYPVVVKADAASIVHKSDMGGVAVNLKNAAEVQKTIEEMRERLKVDDLSFLVQKYLPEGLEIILGAKAEPGLGHLIMFGMGGIYVEVLKDVVFNLTPITSFEAQEMLDSIQLSPILKGVRGQKGIFQNGVTDIIQRLSQLVSDHPMIQELDLNPTLAFEDSVVVVDARISI
ncbi:acetate--CoA ligase family protein, partial [Thermodesulfobacteriota bacterium]